MRAEAELTPLAYRLEDAARMLTIDTRTLRRMIDRGEVCVAKLGRRRAISAAEVNRLLGNVEGSVEGASFSRVRKIKLYQRAI